MSRGASLWFCERGDFWGTVKQLCLCAKCGKGAMKRHDEPRRYSGLFTPRLHMVCDECFDSLPASAVDNADAPKASQASGSGDGRND